MRIALSLAAATLLAAALALVASQERRVIEAAAGQRLREAHVLDGASVTGCTSAPVSGKSSASTSRNNFEPGIRSASGNVWASASVSWKRVRQTRPVFESR